MTNQPLISFIIPVFNEEKNLGPTLRQLKKLDWLDKEIIVADGGSTDNTVKIAQELADKVYVRQPGEKNKTIAENRNKGASLATGRYLFFMDCGVVIGRLDQFTRAVLTVLEGDAKTVGLTVEIRFFPEEETNVDRFNLWMINKGIKGLNKIRMGTAMGWVQVVRRESFLTIKGYNENLITSEDQDLFLRLSRIGRTQVLKNFVAYGTPIRYRKEGWPKMIFIWFMNLLWYALFRKSYSKEWKKVD
ncbi:MAG: glycosyltransferase [Candidatus Komeilibacteria bacterium]|nr:glycosyltransferase [Candidatus Komeilibacteria bacterium]